MKKLSLIIILLVCRLAASAQETGYYVKNNNDTVRCHIVMSLYDEPLYSYYNAKHKLRRKRLSADSVKAFRLTGGKSNYLVKRVEFDHKMQRLFVKLIDSGRINLYRYRIISTDTFSLQDETLDTWYVSKGNDSLKLIEDYVGWPKKQTKVRNLFYSLISDEPEVAAAYMARDGKHSLYYNPNTIDDFIKRYNKAAAAKGN